MSRIWVINYQLKNVPYSLRFHRVTFSVLENMFDVTIGISTRNNKIACTVEMFIFHGSIVSHFDFPGVFSINCNIADIFIVGERICKEDVFFVCRLVWILFIEGLKQLNHNLNTIPEKSLEHSDSFFSNVSDFSNIDH